MNRFKFCPVCKKPLKLTEKGKAVDCRGCSFHYFFNPAPAVAVIISNRNSEILLVGRKHEPKKNYWDLPGGFVEAGESLEEALVREIREELGVVLSGYRYFSSVDDKYPYKGYIYKVVTAYFAASIKGSIKTADDVLSFKWFEEEKLPYNRIAFPGTVEILKKYTGREW